MALRWTTRTRQPSLHAAFYAHPSTLRSSMRTQPPSLHPALYAHRSTLRSSTRTRQPSLHPALYAHRSTLRVGKQMMYLTERWLPQHEYCFGDQQVAYYYNLLLINKLIKY